MKPLEPIVQPAHTTKEWNQFPLPLELASGGLTSGIHVPLVYSEFERPKG